MGATDERPRDAYTTAQAATSPHRYTRDTLEFGRVVNLADAVFAIALTLLVLSIERVEAGALVAFALAFLLVANVWWQHHRIVARLAWLEPGLIAINLVLLAGVALVPFPTSLLSNDPTASDAVLPFVALFAALSAVSIAFLARGQRLQAWQHPLPARLFRWVMVDWGTNLAVLLVSLVTAVWAPLVGLGLLVVGSAVHALVVGRIGPDERRAWF